ncbi:MAG: chorismate mutase, partial [Gammaproteobacteria bacterium]
MADNKTTPNSEPDLAALRREIDTVDEQIQGLINDRARFAQPVAIAKGGDASAVDFFRPEREAQVLRAVVERNAGPLTDEE